MDSNHPLRGRINLNANLLNDPSSPLRQVRQFLSQGDFLTNPAHPMRQQAESFVPSGLDPSGDFLTNPNNALRRHVTEMARRIGLEIGSGNLQRAGTFVFRVETTFRPSDEAFAPMRVGPPPPARPFQPKPGSPSMECTVCLDELLSGQTCCRLPCLHVFHEPCLKEWLKRSQTCPLCKLDTVGISGDRKMRYRLADITGLSAPELRYIATYLGIQADENIERSDLESLVFSCPQVLIMCSQEDLMRLPVSRLQSLLRGAGITSTAGLVEKTDLVDALLQSGRYLKESKAGVSAPPSFCCDTSKPCLHSVAVDSGMARAGSSTVIDASSVGAVADVGRESFDRIRACPNLRKARRPAPY